MRWVRRCLFLLAAAGLVTSVTTSPGAAGAAESGAGRGAGPTQAGGSCARDVLRFAAGSYFYALTVTKDPDGLPFSPDLKATENGAPTEPGQGLWETAGGVRLIRTALDTETCGTHSQAVLQENGEDIIVGVRLRLADYQITQVETYVTREGDYFLWSPEQLLQSDGIRPELPWESIVPEAQRSTREELIQIADDYFTAFGGDVDRTPFQTNCDRWENGWRTTAGDCTLGLPAPGSGSGSLISHRRYVTVDVEAGIVVGYVMFGTSLDFHMFKVVDGGARLIQAVVTGSGHTSTGWEEQEQQP